jgi:hypothetical protein
MGAPSTNFFQNVIFTLLIVAKIGKIDFFFKSLIFECYHSKTVSGVFHDLKKGEIAEKSLKTGQLLPILANFSHIL